MALKVLILDADPAARDELRRLLSELGHQVVGEASGGGDTVALYSFKNLKPDLVLLDVDVPFLEALHSMGQIRKIHAGAEIILITATNIPAEDIKTVGGLGVLRKPCNPLTVKNVLAQFETVHRQRLTQVHRKPMVVPKPKP
jgi:two-component system chemotaxis response regulator CheY